METELRPINDMDLNPPHLLNDDTMSERDPYQNQRHSRDEFMYYNQQQPQPQQVIYQDKKDLFIEYLCISTLHL